MSLNNFPSSSKPPAIHHPLRKECALSLTAIELKKNVLKKKVSIAYMKVIRCRSKDKIAIYLSLERRRQNNSREYK